MIYLITYALVGLLLFGIQSKDDTKVTKTRIWVVILLLTILAACRDKSVGTDTSWYPLSSFKGAFSVKTMEDLKNYLFASEVGIECGYLFLVFISAKVFNSFNMLLFLTAFIINAGTIWGLYRIREHISFNVAVASFCFLFYQMSYNAMRQWMAIGVILFGLKYLYERKVIKFSAVIIVAMLFHRTAIIGIGLYIIFMLVQRKNNLLIQIMVVMASLMFIFGFQVVVGKLVESFDIMEKYSHYAEGGAVGFSFKDTIIRIPPIALSLFLYKDMRKKDESHQYWFLILIIDLILAQLSTVTTFANRVAMYFTISRIIELSLACRVGNTSTRIITKILTISYVMMFWYVNYIYLGNSDTYPYLSEILNIK